MITLNRLGHSDEPFHLNSDMIVTVESTPDTVITLATGAKVVVAETPAEVAAAVHELRAEVLAEAFRRRGRAGGPGAPGGPQSPQPPPTPIQRDSPREPPRLSAVEDDPA
jgi:flagellar protein FlbD